MPMNINCNPQEIIRDANNVLVVTVENASAEIRGIGWDLNKIREEKIGELIIPQGSNGQILANPDYKPGPTPTTAMSRLAFIPTAEPGEYVIGVWVIYQDGTLSPPHDYRVIIRVF